MIHTALRKQPHSHDALQLTFHTVRGKGIYAALFQAPKAILRNELFEPGRMTHVMDVSAGDDAETDVPTTVIKSKADILAPAKVVYVRMYACLM